MAVLHIFNPEHDIALASGLANFTAPHAGRQLRADLGFLPTLWAGEDDVVLVDHAENAAKCCRRLLCRLGRKSCRFVDKSELARLRVESVEPWGWDLALAALLRRKGVSASALPSDEQLERIRQQSHRRTSARLLPLLRVAGTAGEAFECTQAEEVEALLARYGQVVMKAPWSSSGRGLRFLSVERTPFSVQARWFSNLVAAQGSVMVEPYYNKVKDFGMEFSVDATGAIRYEGLSLFHTVNGAYVGNILATERAKQEMLSRYVSADLLNCVQQRIMSSLDLGDYRGPFGIDMMIVAGDDGFLLHPCVEINLRRTMGHVALALAPTDDDVLRVMRIEYDGNHYKLKINKLRL